MNSENNQNLTVNSEATEQNDRREALKKLGKYAAYVAPFTVLALSSKVQAASATGPAPHGAASRGR